LHQQVNVLLTEVRSIAEQVGVEQQREQSVAGMASAQAMPAQPPKPVAPSAPVAPPIVPAMPSSAAPTMPPSGVPTQPPAAPGATTPDRDWWASQNPAQEGPSQKPTPASPSKPWAAPLGGGSTATPGATRDAGGRPATAGQSAAPSGVSGPARPGVPPRPRPEPSRIPTSPNDSVDLETWVGRYGMIGFAVLILLMGIGTFLSWAIRNDIITPAGRVVLGLMAAAAFTAAGFWLRSRDTVKFGNVLLAIALAIVHLCSWSAGPRLHLVPDAVALGFAALASIALAALALADEDETLFVVGVGGALLAPFVTATGRSSGPLTLIYGWVVITTGLFSMRGREWRVAAKLMGFAGALYAGVGLVGAEWNHTTDRLTPPFFALACVWSAALFALDEYRNGLVRAYLITMAIALLVAASQVAGSTHPMEVAPLALAGTVSAYWILRPLSTELAEWLLDGVVLPIAFLATALLAAGGLSAPNGVAITLIWGGASAAAALMNEQERRGPHYLVFGLTTLAAVAYQLKDDQLLLGLGLVAHGVAMIFLMRKERAQLVSIPIALALISALTHARDLIAERPAYVSNPFVNPGAILLLLTLIAWWRFFDAMATTSFRAGVEPDETWQRFARVFLPVALFFWGLLELSSTVSYDVATALVTLYFAVVGVGSINFGRVREIPLVRHVGLALCVIAALLALGRTSRLDSGGLKAATFVIVSLFLLAVAYWYRKQGEVRGKR
jgi:uncharacterized membrane protein